MKYDDLHRHKQECDSQLQMNEGNNCTQYRRQLPLRTGKPLVPKNQCRDRSGREP